MNRTFESILRFINLSTSGLLAGSLSLSILLYTPESVVMPVVTYELYETGAYPALAAFSVLQTLLMFVAIYAAKKIAGVDNFMQLK